MTMTKQTKRKHIWRFSEEFGWTFIMSEKNKTSEVLYNYSKNIILTCFKVFPLEGKKKP